MANTEKLRELVSMFNSLNEKDQDKLVYIAEGMRIAQGNATTPTPDTRTA